MKSLRRSLNNNNSATSPQTSPPITSSSASNPLARPANKVAPPQKVIKALRSHRSTNPQELSYNQGDFWYVTGEREGWYEALNPLVGSRGLVPKADFEEFMKGGRTMSQGGQPRSGQPSRSHTPSQDQSRTPPAMTSPPAPQSASSASAGSSRPPRQPVYAVVSYDFQAERPDELDAKKGEAIVVIAQSNHEWFVAKPIGRLGGPGLIPVAFVEIRDPATGKSIEILPDSIPMVEEWKKATAEYKAASIPLGQFDLPSEQGVVDSPYAAIQPNASQTSLPTSSSQSSQHQSRPLYRAEVDPALPPGEFTALSVPSFHNESGNFWFRLQVAFVPDEPAAPGYTLSLYRTYEDFYDFQISLLDTFPYEAGRPRAGEEDQGPPERILPYMPGPVEDEIDNDLTDYRREELDLYVRALVDLRARGAGYVIRHELFRAFFAAKYGDHCEEVPRETLLNELGELEERLADVRVDDLRSSSRHGPHDRSASAASRHSQPSSQWSAQGHGVQWQGSSSRNSPLPHVDTSRPPSGGQAHYTSGGPSTGITTASSFAAPQLSATTVATTPGTSGGGAGQPPYIKIKIYDRSTDDLIALRVHPNVSHAELFEKVRARLGSEVNVLRYRTSMSGPGGGGYREVSSDQELRGWMRTEDQKLVLYAEQE